MTTRVLTLCRVDVTSLTTSVSTMRFLVNNVNFVSVKSHLKGHNYDKQNLTLAVTSPKTRFINFV